MKLKTLAIETSCDDTSFSIVEFDGKTFFDKHTVSFSQILLHQKYGGVVPEIASREHSNKILEILDEFSESELNEVDFITVTSYPGLPGSLIVGKNTAYTLGEFLGKDVIEVNHIRGHIFSVFLGRTVQDIKFPAIVLTASGGHNDIYLVKSLYDMERLGTTLDDAAGESFDKVSRMLGGPYPGGAWISEKAKLGSENEKVKLSRIFLRRDEYNFSFSGTKSQVYYLLKKLHEQGIKLDEKLICDICYEFQESVVEVLAKKLVRASKEYSAKQIFLTGGVSANDRLYEYTEFQKTKIIGDSIDLIRPTKKFYSTDNGAMIGVEGIIQYLKEKSIKM